MSDWWYNYQMEKDNEEEPIEYEPERDEDSWYDAYLSNNLVISVDLAERSDNNDLPR